MKRSILYLFLIAGVIATGCKKFYQEQPDTLPAATQTGKNTLGFYLDGKLWLPKSKGIDNGIRPVDATLYGQHLNLATTRLSQHLTIIINNVLATGHYDLTTNNNSAQFVVDGTDTYNYTEGSVDITNLDLQKLIISGRFSLKAKNNTGAEITIDQGRFDVKLNN